MNTGLLGDKNAMISPEELLHVGWEGIKFWRAEQFYAVFL
jgi:hypothetical protein